MQPGIAAPAIQPGGISVMLPGETRQVALNTQASNEDGTVMGDFETVVRMPKPVRRSSCRKTTPAA